MSTSFYVVISSSEPQIVGPFPEGHIAAIAFGEAWQAAHNGNPYWQTVEVEDSYWENHDVMRRPYDPAEESRQKQQKFLRDLAQFRDDPQSWVSDLPFTNEMVRQAIITYQQELIKKSVATGQTLDASPLMVAYDYDDLPDHISTRIEEIERDAIGVGLPVKWKWDHAEEGYGEISIIDIGDFGVVYEGSCDSFLITLGGSELSSAQNLYLIPAHLVEEN